MTIEIKPQLVKHTPAKIYIFRNVIYENPLYRGVYTIVASSESEEDAKQYLIALYEQMKKNGHTEGVLSDIKFISAIDANIFTWVHIYKDMLIEHEINGELEQKKLTYTPVDTANWTAKKVFALSIIEGGNAEYKLNDQIGSWQRAFEFMVKGTITNLYHALNSMLFRTPKSVPESLICDRGFNQLGIMPRMVHVLDKTISGMASPKNELTREILKYEDCASALNLNFLYEKCGNRLPHAIYPIFCKTDSEIDFSISLGVEADFSAISNFLESKGLSGNEPWRHLVCTDMFSQDFESIHYEASKESSRNIELKRAEINKKIKEEADKIAADRAAKEHEESLVKIKTDAELKIIEAARALEAKKAEAIKELADLAKKEGAARIDNFKDHVQILKDELKNI